MCPEVNEDNFPQVFHEYVQQERRGDLAKARDRYPYSTDVDVEYYNSLMISLWFSYSADPVTGTTPLEDFVDKYVKDRILAHMILFMQNGVIGEFDLVESDGGGLVTARARSNGTLYRILPALSVAARLAFTKSFVGWLTGHGRDEPYTLQSMAITKSTHRIVMVNDLARDFEEYGRKKGHGREERIKQYIRNAEYASASPDSALLTVLNKLPAAMINHVWDSLGLDMPCRTKKDKAVAISSELTSDGIRRAVDGLSDDGMDCLRYVAETGGLRMYAGLQKRFGRDDTMRRWFKGGSRSTIGALRSRGILFVGMERTRGAWVRIGSPTPRRHKVAVIPFDVLASLDRHGLLRHDP